MSESWQQAAEANIGQKLRSKQLVGGGDFALSYQAELENGLTVFIKTHNNPPAGFFSTEAEGLRWLYQTNTVAVPEVLSVSDDPPYLAMQWIAQGRSRANTEAQFGEQLARLHQYPCGQFGRPDHRTTGSLALPNQTLDSWVEFYAECRLQPLAKIAHDRNALPARSIEAVENIATKLDQFGASDSEPSLLHGDLWAGNRVVDTSGASWLIDPAVHGGHREFDLAMMRLFGGFDNDCFSAYQNVFPLESGWESRIALHQLAPLIVHAIKFGGSYVSAVDSALSQY